MKQHVTAVFLPSQDEELIRDGCLASSTSGRHFAAGSEWQALPMHQRLFQGHGLTRLGSKQLLGASDEKVQALAQLTCLKIIGARLLMNLSNRACEFGNQSNDFIHVLSFLGSGAEFSSHRLRTP